MIHSRRKRSAWFRIISAGLLLVATVMTTLGIANVVHAQAATQVCNNMDSVNNLGPYWINNNLWGGASASGSQCSWDNSISGSTLSWGTSWNWSGDNNTVKSFASAVLGWHWGYKQSGTGLPVQLSSNTNVTTSWNFTLSGSSSQDVSYDIWADPNPNLGSTQASTEIMVWLYKNGSIQPVGSPVGDVSIDGTTWTLWSGNIGWNVYSFVRDTNTTSASLNLNDFFQNLISKQGLSAANYLLGVEAGTEIFTGSGELDVSSYSTVVGGSGSSGGGGGGGGGGGVAQQVLLMDREANVLMSKQPTPLMALQCSCGIAMAPMRKPGRSHRTAASKHWANVWISPTRARQQGHQFNFGRAGEVQQISNGFNSPMARCLTLNRDYAWMILPITQPMGHNCKSGIAMAPMRRCINYQQKDLSLLAMPH